MNADTFKMAEKRLGVSRSQLSRDLGVSRRTLNRYAEGETPIPRYIELAFAAVLYGVKPLDDDWGEAEKDWVEWWMTMERDWGMMPTRGRL